MLRGEEVEDSRTGRLVEVARRFVGEQDARPVDEGARDRDALALAAREFRRPVTEPVTESAGLEEPGRRVADRRPPRRPREPSDADHRGQHRVLEDRQLGQQVVELEHEADVAVPVAVLPPRTEAAQVLARETDRSRARIGAVEPAEDVEERRLPRARTPDDRDPLALGDRDRRVAEDGHLVPAEPVGLAHAGGVEDRRHGVRTHS